MWWKSVVLPVCKLGGKVAAVYAVIGLIEVFTGKDITSRREDVLAYLNR